MLKRVVECDYMPSVAQVFGWTLRSARLKQGLTQKELGARTKTSWTFIGEMERGLKAPNLELVVSLANALNISIEDLVTGLTPKKEIRD
jgi:transcriptional regulator with XRE-family HTH domain